MHKPGLEDERRVFAKKLAQWIVDKREIIYFDEMSVNLWSITERSLCCWQKPDEPIPMVYPDTRGSSVTLIGALGTCIPGYVYFQTADSTNKEDCSEFLVNLSEKLPPQEPGAPKRIVIIDNHP